MIVVGAALRWRRLRPTFWAAVAGLVTLLAATRISPGGLLRPPDSPRYLYPETILFLWILVELAAAWRDAGPARTRTVVAGFATGVLVLGLWSNVRKLDDASSILRARSMIAQGQYSAYDLERGRLRPTYTPNQFSQRAGNYLSAAAAYGSMASLRRARKASQLERASADRALVGALGLELRPARRRRRGAVAAAACRTGSAPGAYGSQAITGDATFTLGRFADAPVARLLLRSTSDTNRRTNPSGLPSGAAAATSPSFSFPPAAHGSAMASSGPQRSPSGGSRMLRLGCRLTPGARAALRYPATARTSRGSFGSPPPAPSRSAACRPVLTPRDAPSAEKLAAACQSMRESSPPSPWSAPPCGWWSARQPVRRRAVDVLGRLGRSLGGVISTVHTDAEITPPLYFVLAWLATGWTSPPRCFAPPRTSPGWRRSRSST